MSRRRSGTAYGGPMVDVRVVCTGRRRHGEILFGVASVVPGADVSPLEAVDLSRILVGPHFFDTTPAKFAEDAKGPHLTYPFRCSRCRPARNIPLTGERLSWLCQEVVRHAGTVLDLSAITANVRK